MMGDRVRNQHYVPQFYLRRFSKDWKSVRAWLVERDRLIPCASIKGQCSESYLYGYEQTVERGLAQLEARFAALFDRIGCPSVSHLSDTDVFDLQLFAALQLQRTAARKRSSDAMDAAFRRYIGESNPELSHASASVEDWGYFGVILPLMSFPLMMDLHVRLLVNKSPVPFILGDDPVCRQNHFLERLGLRNQRGTCARGIQFFFPIGPQQAVTVFDAGAYQVGARDATVVPLRNRKDVNRLNELTYFNSATVVYVPSEYSDVAWREFAHKSKSSWRAPDVVLAEYPETTTGSRRWRKGDSQIYIAGDSPSTSKMEDGFTSTLLHAVIPERYDSQRLSFVQVRPEVRRWRSDNRAVYLRSPAARSLLAELLDEKGWERSIIRGERRLFELWREFARLAKERSIWA